MWESTQREFARIRRREHGIKRLILQGRVPQGHVLLVSLETSSTWRTLSSYSYTPKWPYSPRALRLPLTRRYAARANSGGVGGGSWLSSVPDWSVSHHNSSLPHGRKLLASNADTYTPRNVPSLGPVSREQLAPIGAASSATSDRPNLGRMPGELNVCPTWVTATSLTAPCPTHIVADAARLHFGPGETYDFEFTPTEGEYQMKVMSLTNVLITIRAR